VVLESCLLRIPQNRLNRFFQLRVRFRSEEEDVLLIPPVVQRARSWHESLAQWLLKEQYSTNGMV